MELLFKAANFQFIGWCLWLRTLSPPPLLSRDYRITIFATCHNIRRSHPGPTSSASSSSSDSDRPYLCRSWQRLVSHRLLCCREPEGKNKVPPAGGNKEQRNRHVFTVHCTSSRTKTDKSSSFYVTDEGVEFIWIYLCDFFLYFWQKKSSCLFTQILSIKLYLSEWALMWCLGKHSVPECRWNVH